MRAEDEPDTLKREVVTGVFYYAAVLMAALRILPVRPSVRPSVAYRLITKNLKAQNNQN